MHTSTGQRAAFLTVTATLVLGMAAVAFAAGQEGLRPALAELEVAPATAPAPPVVPEPRSASAAAAPAPPIPDASERMPAAAILRAEPAPAPPESRPLASSTDAQDTGDEQLALTAPGEGAATTDDGVVASGVAAGDQVSDTTHSADTVEVEVTVSKLPDSPGVGQSHGTEIVTVNRSAKDPWAEVRRCESTNNYRINTGNGFYGAYQFTRSTWNWVAEKIDRDDLVGVRPDRAAPGDQDRMANALAFEVRGGGLHHWPVCGRHYGS